MVEARQSQRIMPKEVTPATLPLTVECPRCHAPHGMPCYGAAGQQRSASHSERWALARVAVGVRLKKESGNG